MVNPPIAAAPVSPAHEYGLGCIQHVRAGRDLFDVVVYPSSIVLSRGSRADVALRMVGLSGGLLGYLLTKGVADGVDQTRINAKLALPAAALAAADWRNAAIWLPHVAAAALKKRWFGATYFDLTMTDGGAWSLKWSNMHNEYAYVRQLLYSVLGPRLTTA